MVFDKEAGSCARPASAKTLDEAGRTWTLPIDPSE
jgi:hypothetical protein